MTNPTAVLEEIQRQLTIHDNVIANDLEPPGRAQTAYIDGSTVSTRRPNENSLRVQIRVTDELTVRDIATRLSTPINNSISGYPTLAKLNTDIQFVLAAD